MGTDTTPKRLFGTDGIRGIANKYPMTPEMSLRLGKALAYILKRSCSGKRPKIVVGKDTRLSGYMFEQAITAGIASEGADVLLVGPLPTPAIAFMTTNMRADAGVVISASHNPYEDNGIKFFDSRGFKLPDSRELEIEELVLSGDIDDMHTPVSDIGKAGRIDDAQGRYVVFAKNTFPAELSLEGLTIVLDCANGAAYKVSPTVFGELGAEVIGIGVDPDGCNINKNCGSLELGLLKENVRSRGAHIGIALDGDADRVVFCDERGDYVDGDKILAICAEELFQAGRLKHNTLVATVMSNMALERFLSERGIKLLRTTVGDRYVVEEMRRGGYSLGGEKSGHIVFLEHTTTGDGTLAALQVLATMKRRGKTLKELAEILDLYPQRLTNIKVRDKIPFDTIPGLETLILSSEKKMGGKGRINLRYSGTEPVARLMIEAESEQTIDEISDGIAGLIVSEIGE